MITKTKKFELQSGDIVYVVNAITDFALCIETVEKVITTVPITPEEAGQIGSALYTLRMNAKRKKENESAITFKELEIGRSFRFVNRFKRELFKKITAKQAQRLSDDYILSTSATARVTVT